MRNNYLLFNKQVFESKVSSCINVIIIAANIIKKLFSLILINNYRHHIPQTIFEKVAKEIENLFPGESSYIYFRPYVCKKTTSKKFNVLDNYGLSTQIRRDIYVRLKVYQVQNLAQVQLKVNKFNLNNEENTFCLDINLDESENFVDNSLLFLQYNLSPLEEIEAKWCSKFEDRIKFLKSLHLFEYLNKFPILKEQEGLYLLLLYPNKEEIFFKKWENFKKIVKHIQNTKKKHNRRD